MPTPPRKPGSQVAPGQRPYNSGAPTASTHSKVPIDQATAGKLYRVRDRHEEDRAGNVVPGTVWGENLDWTAANRLKDQVVAGRKSRTARVEEMTVPMPGHEDPHQQPVPDSDDLGADLSVAPDGPTVDVSAETDGDDPQLPAGTVVFDLADPEPHKAPGSGVIMAVPAGHELVVNDVVRSVPATINGGDVVQARPLDPQLAAARAAALAAARPVAARANDRVRYRDKTVVVPKPRTQPVPRDKTVPRAPTVVRLGAPLAAPPAPPPSPLKVAVMQDGKPLSDDALDETDLHDLDVGGGASDADIEHAKKARDAAQGR